MIDRREPTPAQVYDEYLGPTIADPWTQVVLEHAALRSGERVLDVASGTGSVARQAAARVGRSGKVVAVDINEDMLAVGSKLALPAQAARIDWRQGDAARLDMADRSFDVVLCQQGLQFFRDRSAAAREMRRVLVERGRAVISVWQSLEQHPLYAALFEATARHLGASVSDLDPSFSLPDSETLRELLVSAGFSEVETVPHTLTVRLPELERFVQLTTTGAATSIPAFARLDEAARRRLVEAIGDDLRAVTRGFSEDGFLVFPMHSNIAVARVK